MAARKRRPKFLFVHGRTFHRPLHSSSMDDPLKKIRIASPCQTTWEAMSGDDRVRHCSLCSLNVYNFAEMTREEIRELLLQTEGRVCVRLHRRSDGTIITRDCPSRLRALRQRVSRIAAAALAAMVSLSAFSSTGRSCEKPKVRKGAKVKLAIERVANPQKASFSGVVSLDGNPLPGVTIAVTNEITDSHQTTISDSQGAFTFASLDDGIYRIEMTLEAFKLAVIEHLQMKVQVRTLDESITVGAAAVDPMTNGISTTFTQNLIDKLPI